MESISLKRRTSTQFSSWQITLITTAIIVDQAKLLGENILHWMIGKNALEVTFKRKHQVVTMATKSAVKVNGDTIEVDPSLLFRRLAKVVEAKKQLQLCWHQLSALS